ncbi:MAG: hypothetical protein MI807_22540 [Verrucomicrobiales bacterium]|nr:hypothetical protein [Verrucomicrobiales bacterium]
MRDRILSPTEPLSDDDLNEIYRRVCREDPPDDINFVRFQLADIATRMLQNFAWRSSQNDDSAFGELYCLASNATKLYNQELEAHPDWFDGHADRVENIPVLINETREAKERCDELCRIAKPGKSIGLKSKGTRSESFFAKLVGDLIREVHKDRHRLCFDESKRVRLNDLSREPENQRAWWKHIETKLVERYGENFEENAVFSILHEDAVYRDLEERAKASRVRADIKKRLKQALKVFPKI